MRTNSNFEWDCEANNVPLFNGRLHESCNDLGVQEVLFGLLPSFAMSVPCFRFRVQALGLLG
jgi:hypothetical protein